ncbi:MAG: glycosyl hydrolase family 18 protein [bacterium]|nr:glycosyl hydrolase family 18 protein [bacterium]
MSHINTPGKKIWALFAVVYILFAAQSAHAAATSTHDYLRIFYYRNGTTARAAFLKNYKSVDVLAPQSYSLDENGVLKGSVNNTILAFALKNKIKVMPLVTNGVFDRKDGQSILDDMSKKNTAIHDMILEAKKFGYWGWQIDFEQIDVSYRNKFSAFIQKMGRVFKNSGLALSVAVAAQTSQIAADYPDGTWQNMVGVYDYSALAKNADFLTIMSYDDPNSKGPVASLPWTKQVLDYTLQFVSPEKISLGLGLYYWKWNDTKEKLVEIGGYAGMNNVFNKYNYIIGYNKEHEAPFVKYTIKKTPYTLWYENAKSVGKKLDLIKQYGLAGFSAWALGLEVPGIHTIINP